MIVDDTLCTGPAVEEMNHIYYCRSIPAIKVWENPKIILCFIYRCTIGPTSNMSLNNSSLKTVPRYRGMQRHHLLSKFFSKYPSSRHDQKVNSSFCMDMCYSIVLPELSVFVAATLVSLVVVTVLISPATKSTLGSANREN